MRDLQFETRYGKAEEAELAELEKQLGDSLPPDYRRYLLEDGGGWAPRVKFFQVPAVHPESGIDPAEWQWINEFLEWRREPRVAGSLWAEREMFMNREPGDFGLPPEVLPIASATGGAYRVLLGIAGAARGKVFYCDINSRPETPDWSHLETAADSFAAWLESTVDASRVPERYRDV
jgi:hypothetical protein